ncbi:MAG: CTP synthase (UTP-ammonia lyase) [Parasphingorhabdus sp.]|jgi:CTP synthase (UTP-ammonia lyase)
MIKIGLIGDRDDTVIAHQAIPQSLQLAGQSLGVETMVNWLATDSIESSKAWQNYDGLWCVPASSYCKMQGALTAIQFARESSLPFLGTCGGFQHAVLEYARNVLGWRNAEHGETAPDAAMQLVAPLQCSLVEVTELVQFLEGSKLQSAYGRADSSEGYHCSYGLNPEFQEQLLNAEWQISARDSNQNIRGLELTGHPFFVLTLFQPERAALRNEVPPIVQAFLQACVVSH